MGMCQGGINKVTGIVEDAIEEALKDNPETLQKIKDYLKPAYVEAIDEINAYVDSEIESCDDSESSYDAGFEEGLEEGYREAKDDYEEFAIPCPFCNKPLDFSRSCGILRCAHGNKGCRREFNLTERK